MKYIHRTHIYAFLLGFYDLARYGAAMGCAAENDEEWNNSYENGANFAEKIHA